MKSTRNSKETECSCNHMTHFAVLFDYSDTLEVMLTNYCAVGQGEGPKISIRPERIFSLAKHKAQRVLLLPLDGMLIYHRLPNILFVFITVRCYPCNSWPQLLYNRLSIK